MKTEEIYQIIRTALTGANITPTSELNKALYAASGTLRSMIVKSVKAQKPEKSEKLSDMIKHFIDNPLSPEDEAKGLRAMLHAGIAGGDIPAPLLDRLNQIIGVNSGKDESIEIVEFKDAFPDYATAIELCEKPIPVIEMESK